MIDEYLRVCINRRVFMSLPVTGQQLPYVMLLFEMLMVMDAYMMIIALSYGVLVYSLSPTLQRCPP